MMLRHRTFYLVLVGIGIGCTTMGGPICEDSFSYETKTPPTAASCTLVLANTAATLNVSIGALDASCSATSSAISVPVDCSSSDVDAGLLCMRDCTDISLRSADIDAGHELRVFFGNPDAGAPPVPQSLTVTLTCGGQPVSTPKAQAYFDKCEM